MFSGHTEHVVPFTYAPAFAVNGSDTVVGPHVVADVAFCFNVPE